MKKIHIGAHACVADEEGMLWISDFHFNGLFKYDIQTCRLSLVAHFPDVSLGAQRLHSSAHIYSDEVVFMPLYDTKVRIYDKSKKQIISLNIPMGDSNIAFCDNSIMIGRYIFFCSRDFRIWKCDLLNKTVVEDIELSILCKKSVSEKSVEVGSTQSSIIFGENDKNKGWELDLLRRTIRTFEIKIEQDVESIFNKKGKYWFVLRNSLDLLSWDGKNDVEIYKGDENEWTNKEKNYPYVNIFQANDELYVLNHYSKYIMKINEEKKKLEPAFRYPKNYKVLKQIGYGATFAVMYTYKEQLLFVPQRSNIIISYNEKENLVNGVEFSVDTSEVSYWNDVVNERLKMGPIKENVGYMELDEYLGITRKILQSDNDKSDNTGQKIWSVLLGERNR